jgi:putative transposase
MKKTAKEPPRNQVSMWTQLVMPLAALVRGDLLQLVHQLGFQAFATMLEAERTRLCGKRYKHDTSRRSTRGGTTRGELALGGRRVAVRRPRVVDRDGNEIPLSTWTELSSTDPLNARALEQMAIGVATRKYGRSLEDLGDAVDARGTSKSAVSRRFVAMTAEMLAQWMARSLVDLDIWAVFIDGIHFGEHLVLCALGVDATGKKHALGLWEGATENEVACKTMLENLVSRGLKSNRSRLFVIDGSKALRAAIRNAFGRRALVQRCQLHKVRNVLGHLPEDRHDDVRAAIREAYKCTKVDTAKRGTPADGLYVLVEGVVVVIRPGAPCALGLAEGHVFGEDCLLQGAVRSADVRVKGRMLALHIPKRALDRIVKSHPSLGDVLFELLVRRLVTSALQTSALFAAFDVSTRKEVAHLFEVRRGAPGTVIKERGKRSDGLYVALAGEFQVVDEDGQSRLLALGTMFGHSSLLADAPEKQTIVILKDAVVLRLSAARFFGFAARFPAVLAHLSALAERPDAL